MSKQLVLLTNRPLCCPPNCVAVPIRVFRLRANNYFHAKNNYLPAPNLTVPKKNEPFNEYSNGV